MGSDTSKCKECKLGSVDGDCRIASTTGYRDLVNSAATKSTCSNLQGYMLLSLDNYELLTRRQNDSLYILQPGTKWEDKNAAKTYVCPNAEGANKTSDYCIFNNVSDAEKWCSADSGCQGYVVTPSGTTYQASNNIQSGNGNGLFMMKRQQALPPPSTT